MLPDNILNQVILTAKTAGAFIRQERENFNYANVEIKGLNDLVSYVDKTAEELIVKELHNIYKDAGFIVEENTRSEKRDYNWIVDPLDGTTNFIHGIPCYAVSIALEYKGEIVLGVVYEVSRDECFYAQKDKGAFLDGRAIQVSSRQTVSESLIATGFPIYDFGRVDNYLGALKYFMERTHGLRRIGAASVDLCYVACGRMDAYFEYNLKPWDVAAGALIVKEAGGSVYDFSGGNNWLFGKEVSCSNKLLDEEFNTIIREFFS
ncbi:inositol monophosphatase [Sphingobacteriaceae bacterium]|nr:inositol monophosphatase [Sphingobacteriaceae bacterium]